MQPWLIWKLPFRQAVLKFTVISCLCLPSSRVKGVCHPSWQQVLFSMHLPHVLFEHTQKITDQINDLATLNSEEYWVLCGLPVLCCLLILSQAGDILRGSVCLKAVLWLAHIVGEIRRVRLWFSPWFLFTLEQKCLHMNTDSGKGVPTAEPFSSGLILVCLAWNS